MARHSEYLIVLMLLLTIAGCGPVRVGGKFAVQAYHQDTDDRVTPRVVVAFYDEQDRSKWAEAAGPEAARDGIAYPGKSFWRWGAAEAYGWDSHFVFPGVCVLAEGYWPSIMTDNRGPYQAGLPETRWPGLSRKNSETIVGRTEPAPADCDGVWRVLVLPQSHPYDELAQSYTLSAYPDILPAVEAALEGSKSLSVSEKRWAYGQLLHMVQAQLQIEKYPTSQSALRHWQEVFQRRVAE